MIDDKLYANFKREWQKVYDIPFDSSRTQLFIIYQYAKKDASNIYFDFLFEIISAKDISIKVEKI